MQGIKFANPGVIPAERKLKLDGSLSTEECFAPTLGADVTASLYSAWRSESGFSDSRQDSSPRLQAAIHGVTHQGLDYAIVIESAKTMLTLHIAQITAWINSTVLNMITLLLINSSENGCKAARHYVLRFLNAKLKEIEASERIFSIAMVIPFLIMADSKEEEQKTAQLKVGVLTCGDIMVAQSSRAGVSTAGPAFFDEKNRGALPLPKNSSVDELSYLRVFTVPPDADCRFTTMTYGLWSLLETDRIFSQGRGPTTVTLRINTDLGKLLLALAATSKDSFGQVKKLIFAKQSEIKDVMAFRENKKKLKGAISGFERMLETVRDIVGTLNEIIGGASSLSVTEFEGKRKLLLIYVGNLNTAWKQKETALKDAVNQCALKAKCSTLMEYIDKSAAARQSFIEAICSDANRYKNSQPDIRNFVKKNQEVLMNFYLSDNVLGVIVQQTSKIFGKVQEGSTEKLKEVMPSIYLQMNSELIKLQKIIDNLENDTRTVDLRPYEDWHFSSLRLPTRDERRNRIKLFAIQEYSVEHGSISVLLEAKNLLNTSALPDQENVERVMTKLDTVLAKNSPSVVCLAQLLLGQAYLLRARHFLKENKGLLVPKTLEFAVKCFQDVVYKLRFYEVVFSSGGNMSILWGNAMALMENINALTVKFGLTTVPSLVNYRFFTEQIVDKHQLQAKEHFIPAITSSSGR